MRDIEASGAPGCFLRTGGRYGAGQIEVCNIHEVGPSWHIWRPPGPFSAVLEGNESTGTRILLHVKMSIRYFVFAIALAAFGLAQDQETRDTPQQQTKPQTGAAHEIGSGAGTIGRGAMHGAGDLAWGTAKGVGSLATLHPVDAGVSVGKGAVAAGKDVGVGTAKGAAKIGKGIGKLFKKI